MVILVQEVLFVVGKLKDLKDLYDEYSNEIDEVQISLRALKQILTAREDSAQAASHAALLGSGSIQEELRAVFNQMYGAVVEFDLVVNGYDGDQVGGGAVDPLAMRGNGSGWATEGKMTLATNGEEEDRSIGSKRLTAARKSKAFGRKLFAATKAKAKIATLTSLKVRLDNLLKMASLETGTQQARSLQTLTGQNAAEILASLSDDCRLFWTQCFGSRTSVGAKEFIDALRSMIGRDISALLGPQCSVFFRIVQQMLLDGGGGGGNDAGGNSSSSASINSSDRGGGDNGQGGGKLGGGGGGGGSELAAVGIYSYLQLITTGSQSRNYISRMTASQRATITSKASLVEAITGLMASFDGCGVGAVSSLVTTGHVVGIAKLQTFNAGAQSHLMYNSETGGSSQTSINKPTQVLLSYDLLGEIKIWSMAPNTNTLELLNTIRVFRPLRAACVLAPTHNPGDEAAGTYQNRCSTAVAYTIEGGTSVEVMDLDGTNRFTAVQRDSPIRAIASCQGKNGACLLFVLASMSSRVDVYDVGQTTAQRVYTITGHSATVVAMEAGWLSCGTPILLAITALGEVAMWNVQTFTKVYSFVVPAPTYDGSFLTTATTGGSTPPVAASRTPSMSTTRTTPTTSKPPSAPAGSLSKVTFASAGTSKQHPQDSDASSVSEAPQTSVRVGPMSVQTTTAVSSIKAKPANIQKVRMIRYTTTSVWIAVLTDGWVVIYEIRGGPGCPLESPSQENERDFDASTFLPCPNATRGHRLELVAAIGSRNSFIADFDINQACLALWVQSRHDTRVASAGSMLIWIWNKVIRGMMGLPPLFTSKFAKVDSGLCDVASALTKDGETVAMSGYDVTRVKKGVMLVETGYYVRAEPFRIPCVSEPKGLAIFSSCIVWGDDQGTLMSCPTRGTSHNRCPFNHEMHQYSVIAEDGVECASCHSLLEDGITLSCVECSVDICFACINPLLTSNERAQFTQDMKTRQGGSRRRPRRSGEEGGKGNLLLLSGEDLDDLDDAENMKLPSTPTTASTTTQFGTSSTVATTRSNFSTESAKITVFSGHASWAAHDLSLTTPFSKFTMCHLPHGYMTVFGGHSISTWVLCGTFCGQVQVFGYSEMARTGGWVLRSYGQLRGSVATYPLLKRQRAAMMHDADDATAVSLGRGGFAEHVVDESMYSGTLGQSNLLSQSRPAVPTITVLTRVKQHLHAPVTNVAGGAKTVGNVIDQAKDEVSVKLLIGSDQGHIGIYSCQEMESQFRYLDSDSHCARCGVLPVTFVERLSNMCYGCYLVSYPISALRIPALLGEQYGAWVWKIPLRRVEGVRGGTGGSSGGAGDKIKAFFNRKISSWKRRFLEVLPDPRGEVQAMLVYHENIPTEAPSNQQFSDTASVSSTTRDRWSSAPPESLASRIAKSKGNISLSSRSTIEEVSVKEMISLGCPIEVSMCGARVAVVSGGSELSGSKQRERVVEELFLAFESDHDRNRFLQLLSKQTLTPHSPCLNCRRTKPDVSQRRLVPKGEMLCNPCVQELSTQRCRSVSAIQCNGTRIFVGLLNTAPEKEEVVCMGNQRTIYNAASVERIKSRGGIIEEFNMDVSLGPKVGGVIRFSGESQHMMCLGTQFLIIGTGMLEPALQVYRCMNPTKTARSQLHASLNKDGKITAIAACEGTKRNCFCVSIDSHEIHVHELVGRSFWDGPNHEQQQQQQQSSDRQVLLLGRYSYTPSPSSRVASFLHSMQMPDKSLEVSAGFQEGGIFVWKHAHFGKVREDFTACSKSLYPAAELAGHKCEVTSIIRHKEVLKSAANDNTVHFWRLDRLLRAREKRLDRNMLRAVDVEPAQWDWVWLAKNHNYRRDGPPTPYWYHNCSSGRRDPRFITLNKHDGRLLYQAWLQFRDKVITPGKSTFHMPLSSFLQEVSSSGDASDESYSACFNIDYDAMIGTLVAKRSMKQGKRDPVTGECEQRDVVSSSWFISHGEDRDGDATIEDAATLLSNERYLIYGYKTLATNSLEYSPIITGTNVLDATIKRRDVGLESGEAICLPFPISMCGDCSGPFGTILSATVSFSVVSTYSSPSIPISRFGPTVSPKRATPETLQERLQRLRGYFYGYSLVAAQFVKIDSDEGQTYQVVNSNGNGISATVSAFNEFLLSRLLHVAEENNSEIIDLFSSSNIAKNCSAGGILWQLIQGFLLPRWEAAWGKAFGEEAMTPAYIRGFGKRSGVPTCMGVTFGIVGPTDEAVQLQFPGFVRHSVLDTSVMLFKNITPIETQQLTQKFANTPDEVTKSAKDVVTTLFATKCARVTIALSREMDVPELQLTAAPGDLDLFHRNIQVLSNISARAAAARTTPIAVKGGFDDDGASSMTGASSEGGLSSSMSMSIMNSSTNGSAILDRLLPSSDLGDYAKRLRVSTRKDGVVGDDAQAADDDWEDAVGASSSHGTTITTATSGADFTLNMDDVPADDDEPMVIACPICLIETTKEEYGWEEGGGDNRCRIHTQVRMVEVSRDAYCAGCQNPHQPLLRRNCTGCGMYLCLGCCNHTGNVCATCSISSTSTL